MNKKIIGMVSAVTLVFVAGTTTALAASNPDSGLGALLFSTKAEAQNHETFVAIEEDGTTRSMTQEEMEIFTNTEEDCIEGGISADGGATVMSPGSSTDMPLVIEDDGTVREMTQDEFDSLAKDSDFSEFSASSDNEVSNGTFGE